jgi:CheY-like chemotaxis protein
LNSLLILSDQLSNNPEGNLTARQTEFAKTIHSSGNELLMLINDILDLSKIESGTVVVDASELRLDELQGYVERTFRHVAESKNVAFYTKFDTGLPKSMFTDAKRLQQIIKNLLSNAFKFTQHGHVTLSLETADSGWSIDNDDLNRASDVISFSVIDSGIGIPVDKQQIIFEAFQQADGSTSRKYGGTGLGLAISRELSRLLGGEIRLASVPGKGSTFTLYLPLSYAPSRTSRRAGLTEGQASTATIRLLPPGESTTVSRSDPSKPSRPGVISVPHLFAEPALDKTWNEAGDDRDEIRAGDRVLMIVENDLAFAKFLLETAREMGFKGLVTPLGASALSLTREFQPDAITLDIHLPDIDGWRVLDRLKNDLSTRHIPVSVISTDESRDRALSSGALMFAAKPLQNRGILDKLLNANLDFLGRKTRDVLLIDPDEDRRKAIVESLNVDNVLVRVANDVASGQQSLRDHNADCLIVNPSVANLFEISPEASEGPDCLSMRKPMIVYSQHDTPESVLQRLASHWTVRQARSADRLQDLTSFFLHRNVALLPQPQQQMLRGLYHSDRSLSGKKVLIVDDDMRNIFALSMVLEEHNLVIASADNGRDAITLLQNDDEIDIVLMDIMMPEMDGMETMREIRKISKLKFMPIIAVTAKAMKGDREKCIEAGAWDYLSKPVDPEQMLAALRAWLYR